MEAFEDALDRTASARGKSTRSDSYSTTWDRRTRRAGIVGAPPPARPTAYRTATAEKRALRDDTGWPPPPPAYSRRDRFRGSKWWKEPWFIWSMVVLVLAGIGAGVFVVIRNAKYHDMPEAEASNSTAPVSGSAIAKGTAAPLAAPPASGTATSPAAAQSSSTPDTRSFYGICYEPSQMNQDCGFTAQTVEADMKLLATLSKRVRVYSSKCNQAKIVLTAIKTLGLDLEMTLGVRTTTDNADYTSDATAAIALLKEFGTKMITRVTVGNEFVMASLTANLGDMTATVVKNMQDFKQRAAAAGIKVPIGTSEAPTGLMINDKPNTQLVDPADFVMANVHAWWGGVPGAQSAQNTFDSWNVLLNEFPVSYHSKFLLGETGWPASTPGEAQFVQQTGSGSPADMAGLQSFLDGFVCKANTQRFPFWFFQLIDEPGKGDESDQTGVENHWGLYLPDNTLKPGLKLPTCRSG